MWKSGNNIIIDSKTGFFSKSNDAVEIDIIK